MYVKKDNIYFFSPTTNPTHPPTPQQMKACRNPRKSNFDHFCADKLSAVQAFECAEEFHEELGKIYCNCYDYQVDFYDNV